MGFSNAGSSLTTLTDCPICKYGTLDLFHKDGKPVMICADCDRRFTPEELKKFGIHVTNMDSTLPEKAPLIHRPPTYQYIVEMTATNGNVIQYVGSYDDACVLMKMLFREHDPEKITLRRIKSILL